MSPAIAWLTASLWLLPVGFVAWAAIAPTPDQKKLAGAIAVFLLVVYGAIWLVGRPSQLVVSDDGLDLVFPLWRRHVPRAKIADIRLATQDAFHQEFGFAIRVGAGGLWGGFGWLWTARQGWVEFYVSRFDTLAIVERFSAAAASRSPDLPLVLTPDRAEEFVAAVRALLP